MSKQDADAVLPVSELAGVWVAAGEVLTFLGALADPQLENLLALTAVAKR